MTIPLRQVDAPRQPPEGAPCNGCGCCCVARRCSISTALFPQVPPGALCPALAWESTTARFWCLVVAQTLNPDLAERARAWLGIGAGCSYDDFQGG